MGLRSRIKGRIKQVLGQNEASPPGSKTPAPAPAPAPVSAPTPADEVPARPPPPPTKTVTVEKASPPVEKSEGPKPISEEKVQRHLAKTRKGVLSMVQKNGGTATLAEMHDFSERRYFIAHKKFSDLMESMIADEQIDYDHAEGVATLTDKGIALVNS